MGNLHMSLKQTLKRVKRMGINWPTMLQDLHAYVRACYCGMIMKAALFSLTTLYPTFPKVGYRNSKVPIDPIFSQEDEQEKATLLIEASNGVLPSC